jgi:hypothetical protein
MHESYEKHFVAGTGLGHEEPTRSAMKKCYKMPYKPDIIHYFFEFAPFKSFLNENEQF